MSDQAAEGLLDRAWRRIGGLWRDMAATVAGEADDDVAAQMRACLAARGGEVSARNRAAKLAEAYLALDAEGQLAFFRTLASFDSDPDEVAAAMHAVGEAADENARTAARTRLRQVLEPPRVRLLTQFTTIPDGMKFLVGLRAALLPHAKSDPALAALEADFRNLLRTWFDVGFLELRHIDWNSPASLLEKLVGYEAVHQIRSWRDLKNRLDIDRRCYAFFHPRMPDEPLIFVEVALTKGLAENIQRLLDESAPHLNPKDADTAIFYSISNCQRGLDGISFGNFLIKRVVGLLGDELRSIKTFATLSPIPGFRRWLDQTLKDIPASFVSEEESAALMAAAPGTDGAGAALSAILAKRGWHKNPAAARAAEPVLMRLCARYLLIEAARGGKRARDPVAHFHLSNGARVERINWLADVSDKGVKEGAGMMVNYLYDPAKIEEWHEAYAGEGKRTASTAARKLARGWS